MYQKNQNQTQVPNLNNASVQHPSTSQPGGMVPEARQALEDMKYEIAGELGISQVQVSRLEKRILKEMRKKL